MQVTTLSNQIFFLQFPPIFSLFFLHLNSICHQKKRSHFSPHGSKRTPRPFLLCAAAVHYWHYSHSALARQQFCRTFPAYSNTYTHVNAHAHSLYRSHAGACGLPKPQSLSDQERLVCMCLTSIMRPLPFSRCTWAACNDRRFFSRGASCVWADLHRARGQICCKYCSLGRFVAQGRFAPMGHLSRSATTWLYTMTMG